MTDLEPAETREGASRRLLKRIRAADRQPSLLKAVATVRRLAPGDPDLGGPGAGGDQAPADLLVPLLVSDTALERLDDAAFESKRKRRFKAKGAPKDLEVYELRPAGA